MLLDNRCPGCGNVMPEDAASCPNCGSIVKEIGTIFPDAGWMGSTRVRSAQPSEIEQPLAPVKKESPALKGASLTVIQGANKGAEYPLVSEKTRIGREKIDNEITLDDTQVSRNHAVITFENRQYTLEDLHSSNGTKVNGQPVTRHALVDGDVIQIGDTHLAFYL